MLKMDYDAMLENLGENPFTQVAAYLFKMVTIPEKTILYAVVIIDFEKEKTDGYVTQLFVKELEPDFSASELRNILIRYEIKIETNTINAKKEACKLYRLDPNKGSALDTSDFTIILTPASNGEEEKTLTVKKIPQFHIDAVTAILKNSISSFISEDEPKYDLIDLADGKEAIKVYLEKRKLPYKPNDILNQLKRLHVIYSNNGKGRYEYIVKASSKKYIALKKEVSDNENTEEA